MDLTIGGLKSLASSATLPSDAPAGAQAAMGVVNELKRTAMQAASFVMAYKNRGIIKSDECGIKVTFQYNPEEITDSLSANWTQTEVQGQMSPVYTFANGGAVTKRFEILLDAHATLHPLGHIGVELDKIEMLRVPHDKAGKPIALPVLRAMKAPNVSKDVVGVPPLVTILYGRRVQKGYVTSIEITEMLHGTTPQTLTKPLPTRAKVSFEFLIVEDKRLIIGG